MKLRARFLIYLSLVCLIPLLSVFSILRLLLLKDKFNPLFSGRLYTENIFGFVVILMIALPAIVVSGLYFKSFLNRIKELTDYFKLLPNEDLPDLKPDRHDDELGNLRQSLIEMLLRLKQNRAVLEEHYRKLLLSNMNLEEKYAQTYTIQLILEEIGRELDLDRLLKKTSDIIMGVFGSRRCIIYMVDELSENLVIRADSEITDLDEVKLAAIAFDSENIIARSWRLRRVLTESDAKPKELKAFKARNVPSFSIFPLTGRREGLGVIIIEHQMAGGFTADLEDFAKLIAQEISLSVETAYLYEKMRHMANHDGLTGVYNRMYLMNYMSEIFANEPGTVSVVMFDLDHFKKVNDKYGHLAGDMVLKTVTSIMQKMLPTGILGRYGGEEFVLILPKFNQEEAYKLADSIRQKISKHNFVTNEGIQIPVTISGGLANHPQVSDGFKGLLQLADEALYEAKNTGRNKICSAGTKDLLGQSS